MERRAADKSVLGTRGGQVPIVALKSDFKAAGGDDEANVWKESKRTENWRKDCFKDRRVFTLSLYMTRLSDNFRRGLVLLMLYNSQGNYKRIKCTV